MVHPLEHRVDIVRSKAAWGLRFIAACRILIVLLATALSMGVVDYFLRSPEPLIRWLLSAAVVAALVLAVWRWGVPLLHTRLSRIAAARRIENRFPELRNCLSNSVAFASNPQGDVTAGSLELRRAVIAETDALATHLDFSQALDHQPMRRAGLSAAVAVIGLATMAVLFPVSSGIAARRLLMPWNDTHWPLRHSLAFVDAPEKLAAGTDFEAQIVDRNGRLPENVRLLLRFDGTSGRRSETIEMKPLDGRMVHRLENITQPFAYRATGGDDYTMPWTQVTIIEPPELTHFTLHVRPPRYAGWADERLERVARVLAGSQLAVSGKLDKPATSVRLRGVGEAGTVLEGKLSADGRSFTLPADATRPWIATKSGTYAFELLDENGIPGGGDTRVELQVVADAPPAIAWEIPTDQTFVTPQAIVPIKALVKDDLLLERVSLKYLRPDATDAAEHTVDLYLAPVAKAGVSPTTAQSARREDGQSLSISSDWDLAGLGLQPGNVLAVRIEAADFRPQTATTAVRRISIVDHAELENRLLQQQTSVFTQLAEALRLQRESHGQVTAVQFQLDESQAVQPRDIDQLQAAELMQRQVHRLLNDPKDGVDARLASLLNELANNRVESQNLTRRLSTLQSKIRQINQDWMSEIAQQLTAALKTAREIGSQGEGAADGDELASIGQSLTVAEGQQRQVIEELESLLGELSEWDNFSRLAREIGQIRQQQQKTQQETESLRWKIATTADEQPTADQRAAARQLAARQQDLARRFDKLQGRMDELHNRLESSDPQTARTLAEGNELGRRLAIGGQMRQAGRELTEYRVGASQQTQEAVLKSLAELLDALSSRRDRELLRTVESLKEARSELDQLRTQQKHLAEVAQQAIEEPNPEERKRQLMRLAKEQSENVKRAEELRRKLERLQAKRPAESASGGVQSMKRTGEAAASGDAADAARQAEEASRLLDEARRQLQEEIEQAQADLVREQLTRLEQSLAGLVLRQKNVVAEIERLQSVRGPGGPLSTAQRETLGGIASEEELLASEVKTLRAKLTDAAAFSLALEGVEREMQTAAGLMSRGSTSTQTRQAAEAALKRLEQVLSALKQESSSPPEVPEAQNDEEGGVSGEQQEGESLVRSLAELRLMAEMQAEINRRTAEIETSRQKSGDLMPDQSKELEALAAEQGKLADMIFELAQTANKDATDIPELPPLDDRPAEAPGTKKPGEPGSLDEQLLRDLLENP